MKLLLTCCKGRCTQTVTVSSALGRKYSNSDELPHIAPTFRARKPSSQTCTVWVDVLQFVRDHTAIVPSPA